jgi:hypothetical protein
MLKSDQDEPTWLDEFIRSEGLEITRNDGWSVGENGTEISRVFETECEARHWASLHVRFFRPRCCCCGSTETRPDDPWEIYSTSCSTGHDWMHQSCRLRFDPGALGESEQRSS